MIFDSTLLAALVAELQLLRGERLRDIWQSAGMQSAGTSAGEKNTLPKGAAARGAAARGAVVKGAATKADAEDSDAAATGRAVYLAFRGATLLIDTHPQRARLHLAADAPEPPPFSTAFGGVLRRALRGARLTTIEQPGFDRALHLRFEARDDVGNLQCYTLVAELMERRSNLILLDDENVIVDALKRLPPFLNRARTILPHRPYQPPPSDKQNPLAVSDWNAALTQAAATAASAKATHSEAAPTDSEKRGGAKSGALVNWLRAHYFGISPLVGAAIETLAREAASENTTFEDLAPASVLSRSNALKSAAPESNGNIFTPAAPAAPPMTPVAQTLRDSLVAQDTRALRDMAAACDWFFARARRAVKGDFNPVRCGAQPYPFALPGRDCQLPDAVPASAPSRCPLNVLVEQIAASEEEQRALSSERAALLAHLAAREKRNAAQREDVAKALRHAADAATFSRYGQLLLTYITAVEDAARQDAAFVELPDDLNWTGIDEGTDATEDAAGGGAPGAAPARIAIEPKWSAADNATRYFNRARRARKLGADAPGRRAGLDEEAAQLGAWRAAAQAAVSSEELRAVARECGLRSESQKEGGAGKAPSGKALSRTKQREAAARPENKLRRREVEGWQLWMGRSALENQTLLSKVAAPSDIWMHVRGEASAHVLIKNQKGKNPPPRVLEEAGRWLATAGRSHKAVDERVEIIYTPAKWVRAVKGAPGRVTLQRFETLLLHLA